MKGLSVLIENSAFTKDLDLKSCLPPQQRSFKKWQLLNILITPYLLQIFSWIWGVLKFKQLLLVFPLPLDGWLYKKYKRIQKNRMQDIIRYFGYFFLAKNTVFIWPLFEAQKQLHLYLNKNWGNFNNLLEWSISQIVCSYITLFLR